jgi:hypothetical protein
MYASHTGGNDRYGVPVEKELMKKQAKVLSNIQKMGLPLKFVLQIILYGSSCPFGQPFE